MGARDGLYVAEVYDVAQDGTTSKADRTKVFYTKEPSRSSFTPTTWTKSLAPEAPAHFRPGAGAVPDRREAVNLGIFYEDNAAKKRWVLKFNDPNVLEQIDAVFVTVEPNGGSHKPSGNPGARRFLPATPSKSPLVRILV